MYFLTNSFGMKCRDDVEVHAAPGKARTVFDFHTGNRPLLCPHRG